MEPERDRLGLIQYTLVKMSETGSEVRVRTPLFGFHVVAITGVGAGLGLVYDLWRGLEDYTRPPLSGPPWLAATAVLLACLGLLALLVWMEVAVRQGWDPPFFRVRVYGAQVVGKLAPQASEPIASLSLRFRDGKTHVYMADPVEFAVVQVGDYVVAETFGKFIAHVRVLERSARPLEPEVAQAGRRTLVSRNLNPNTMDYLVMGGVIPVCGWIVGSNFLPLVYLQDVYFVGRRRFSRVRDTLVDIRGDEAFWFNIVPVTVALLAIVVVSVIWVRGWRSRAVWEFDEAEQSDPPWSRRISSLW